MTIYEELVERVSNGETFHIDFEKKTMKIGKETLIKNGEYDSKRNLITAINTDAIGAIESLYKNYKYSLPSERSDSKRRTYFKALSIDELTDEQLILADRREIAQAALEGYILCMTLNEQFKWPENTGWFWQSKNDEDLVILKQWIEKGE